jgi:hypothetical protein
MRRIRHLCPAQQGQIKEQRKNRRRRKIGGYSGVGFCRRPKPIRRGFNPHGLNLLELCLFDPVNAVPRPIYRNHIAGTKPKG